MAALWAAVVAGPASLAAPAGNAPRPPRRIDPWETRLTVTWDNQPLEAALAGLAASSATDVWRDRRVDPTTPVRYRCRDRRLAEILDDLAEQHALTWERFGPLAYVAPRAVAPALAERSADLQRELKRLPAPARKAWQAARWWQCDRLSEPRELVGRLVAETGLQLANPETIPHDLWDARTLPQMTAADRLVVLLANFDLVLHVSRDGGWCTLAPRAATPPGPAAAARRPPKRPRGAEAAAASAAAKRFSLRVQSQPLGAVLDRLAEQTDLEIAWEGDVDEGQLRRQRVDCDVRDANLDGLLAALLEPLGLVAVADADRVVIGPRPTPPNPR